MRAPFHTERIFSRPSERFHSDKVFRTMIVHRSYSVPNAEAVSTAKPSRFGFGPVAFPQPDTRSRFMTPVCRRYFPHSPPNFDPVILSTLPSLPFTVCHLHSICPAQQIRRRCLWHVETFRRNISLEYLSSPQASLFLFRLRPPFAPFRIIPFRPCHPFTLTHRFRRFSPMTPLPSPGRHSPDTGFSPSTQPFFPFSGLVLLRVSWALDWCTYFDWKLPWVIYRRETPEYLPRWTMYPTRRR